MQRFEVEPQYKLIPGCMCFTCEERTGMWTVRDNLDDNPLEDVVFDTEAEAYQACAKFLVAQWAEANKTFWRDSTCEWLADKHQVLFHEIFCMQDMEPQLIVFHQDTAKCLVAGLDRWIEENRVQSHILPHLERWRTEVAEIQSYLNLSTPTP